MCLFCGSAQSENGAVKAQGATEARTAHSQPRTARSRPKTAQSQPGQVLVAREGSPRLRVPTPSRSSDTTTFGGERFRVWGGWLCGPERGGTLYLGLLKPRNFSPTVTPSVPERRWFKRPR